MGGKWLRVQASPHSRQKKPKQKSEYKGCSGKICKDKKWVLCWGKGFPAGPSGKESTWQCRRHKRCEFDPWVRKIPWRRAWQPIPVFLPVESHRQRSLAGYSPWGSQRVVHDWNNIACTHMLGKTRVWDKNMGRGRNGVEGEGVWSEFRALRFDISTIELYWFVKLSWVKLWTQAAMSGEKWYEWNRRLQNRGGQGSKRLMVQWTITWLFTSRWEILGCKEDRKPLPKCLKYQEIQERGWVE